MAAPVVAAVGPGPEPRPVCEEPALELGLIESAPDLAALAGEWTRLHARAGQASVFTSWEWQSHWWRCYGTGALRTVVARQAGRLVGVLPLHIATRRVFGARVAVLQFIGVGGDTRPDDLGPLVESGRERQVGERLAGFALDRIRDWDVLDLGDIPEDWAFAGIVWEQIAARRLRGATGTDQKIRFIELPASYEAFLASLHRDRRHRMRHLRRRVAGDLGASFHALEDLERLDPLFDKLAALHVKRWERAGQEHSFDSSAYLDFHRSVVRALFPRDGVRLFSLEREGEPIAIYYFYRFRGALFLMQGAFDPDLQKYRPGHALMGWCIEDAIRDGLHRLDFLRGDHRYKDELSTGVRTTRFVRAYRNTTGAWLMRVRLGVVPAARRSVRQTLRRLGLVGAPGHGD